MDNTQTISKNFYDREILGVMEIDGKKVLYLKPGVKRRFYAADMSNPKHYKLETHINDELVNFQRWEDYYKKVVGVDDYEQD